MPWPRRFAAFIAVPVAIAIAIAAGRSTPLTAAPAGIQGPGSTRLVVVNRDTVQSAAVAAEFRKQGTVADAPLLISNPRLPAMASMSISEPAELTNGAYAVTASSDRSIGTVAVTHWPLSGGAIASDSAEPSQEVVVPLAMVKYLGHSSLLTIQSAAAGQAATVTIDLFGAGVDTPVVSASYQVQPGSSITIDLLRDAAFAGVRANSPRGFMGSLRVSSAVEVAVHVVHDVEVSRRSVYDHNGLPRAEGSALLHVPLVVHGKGREPGRFEWTWLGVMNADSRPTTVQVTYRGFGGTCVGQVFVDGSRPLPPLTMAHFGTDDDSAPAAHLPLGCLASATIASDGARLAAVVVHHFDTGGVGATRWAAASLAMPTTAAAADWILWRWHRLWAADGGISEAIVHNPGQEVATVDLQVRGDDGISAVDCGAPCHATIPAGSTHRFVAEDEDMLAAQFSGSAVVRSNQPVLVWLRDTFRGGDGDETLSAAVPAAVAGSGALDRHRRFSPLFLIENCDEVYPSPAARTATPTLDPTATPSATATSCPLHLFGPACEPTGTATPDEGPTRAPLPGTPSPVPSSTSTPEPTRDQRRTIHLPFAHRA